VVREVEGLERALVASADADDETGLFIVQCCGRIIHY
jgi:hypothetical protein